MLRLWIPFGVIYLTAVGVGLWQSGLQTSLLVALVIGILGLAGETVATLGKQLSVGSVVLTRRLTAGVGETAFGLAVFVSATHWYQTDEFGLVFFLACLALAISKVGSGIRALRRQ